MVLVYTELLCSRWCRRSSSPAVISSLVWQVSAVVLLPWCRLLLWCCYRRWCCYYRRGWYVTSWVENEDLANAFLARRNVSSGIFGGVAVVAGISACIVLEKMVRPVV